MVTEVNDKPKYGLKVSDIGPISLIDGELSHYNRNLIFANNGTGKSFISRSLQLLLDGTVTDNNKTDLIRDLVQQESKTRIGDVKLLKGQDIIAEVLLSEIDNSITVTKADNIFCVFNSSYVEEEVRQRKQFEFEEKILGELIIGKGTAALEASEASHKNKKADYQELELSLSLKFEIEKESIIEKTSVTKGLNDYKNLIFNNYLDHKFSPKNYNPEATLIEYTEAISSLKNYDQIPDDITPPSQQEFSTSIFNLEEISDFLKEPISLTNIAEEFKLRINKNLTFIEKGTNLYIENNSNCPFCEQDLSPKAQGLIEAYVSYFTNKEAAAKKKCNELLEGLKKENILLARMKQLYAVNNSQYEQLKSYVVELKNTQLINIDDFLSQFIKLNDQLIKWLQNKEDELSIEFDLGDRIETQVIEREKLQKNMQVAFEHSNPLIEKLNSIIENTTEAKKTAKRVVCLKFQAHFYASHMDEFKTLKNLNSEIIQLTADIAQLKLKSDSKVRIEDRVFATFESLLLEIFGTKYSFDKTTRRIKLGDEKIVRKAENTFSDGEKNIIGLCYFLSELHKYISEKDDYKKLFVIIDDPVSSLSFNYIYAVLDILKKLRINDGQGLVFNNTDQKVPILLLTHNDHLFNMAFSNNIFKSEAAFQLHQKDGNHKLTPLKNIITPHYEQLKHCIAVAAGDENSSHYTPNSIRSVMEGMWKFCKPDLQNFGEFIQHLEKDGLNIKSTFINALSHGSHHYNSSQFETDMLAAAKEAILVVEKYASGQLKKAMES